MTATKKLRELWRRLSFYFSRERFDRELDDEMRFHLEMKAKAKIEDGDDAVAASFAAKRQFGNQMRLKERSREMWSFTWIESLFKDLQYSLRMIRKSPVFASVVILSLALAIGSNTAIFTLVDAVLLKKLPVKNPEELVLFGWAAGTNGAYLGGSGNGRTDKRTGIRYGSSLSTEIFEQMKKQNQTLTDLFACYAIYPNMNVSIDNRAEIAAGQVVSGGYYKGLGVRPIIGRTITDEDDKVGAPPVAVISYDYWKNRFGSDPSIVGKNAFVNGVAVTIIGVTQPGFVGALGISRAADLSMPLSLEPLVDSLPRSTEGNWWLRIMGRLKPGATIEQAHANFEPLMQQSAMERLRNYLAERPDPRFANAVPPMLTAIPGGQGDMFARSDYVRELYMLLIIVGLVLLIACVNVANLLLARSSVRQKEIAIRISLGAGRWRLIRQLLTESLVLAVTGGALGLLLAYLSKELLLSVTVLGGDRLKVDTGLDLKVLGFTAAATIATGILFGIAPALKATRIDPGPALKDPTGSDSSGRSRLTMGKGLIVIQVGLSVVLLVGAGLFLRTLRNLQHVDYGFDAQNLLLFDVNPSLNGYKGEALSAVYRQIADRLETIPGAKSATITMYPFMRGDGWQWGEPKVPGAKKVFDPNTNCYLLAVGNNFFQTMRMPLLAGRQFDARDSANAPKVAIVNQTFVKLTFDDDKPIGEHFKFDNPRGEQVFEVAGIVKDSIYYDLRNAPPPVVYFPYEQHMAEIDRFAEGMTYEVRTSGDPTAIVPAVRDLMRSIDGKIPIENIKTQSDQIDESLSDERVFAKFTSAIGLLVLILAGIGLYGVMSYNVTRRTKEIGIRMALGAGAKRVLGQVMRETLLMVAIGIVFGAGASYVATNVISAAWFGIDDKPNMLFGVGPHDPFSIALAAIFLLVVAAIAGYLPARRAARVDPLTALRYE